MEKPTFESQTTFIRALRNLISSIGLMDAHQQPAEEETRHHLIALLKAVEGQNRQSMDACATLLKQFWLDSIPWCSQLSKDVEKVLILYDEYFEEVSRNPTGI